MYDGATPDLEVSTFAKTDARAGIESPNWDHRVGIAFTSPLNTLVWTPTSLQSCSSTDNPPEGLNRSSATASLALGLLDGPSGELVVAEVRPGRRTPERKRSHHVMLTVADVTKVVAAAMDREARLVDAPHD
jgi:hypothetical protein